MESDIKEILNEYEIKDEDRDNLAKEIAEYTKQVVVDQIENIKSDLDNTKWDLEH